MKKKLYLCTLKLRIELFTIKIIYKNEKRYSS